MPSAQVSIWVPIVVGLLGFVGVLGAQLIAGWREDRRWRREVQREELRWERERTRIADERRYAGREAAYARVTELIEAWSWVLYPAKEQVLRGRELTEDTRTALRELQSRARNTFGPANLHAPNGVRELMRDTAYAKDALTNALLAGDRAADEVREEWHRSRELYDRMRAAMRQDLGVG